MYCFYLPYLLMLSFILGLNSQSVNIEVFGLGECYEPVDGDIKLDTNFKSESPKSVDINADIPFDILCEDVFHMDVHQMIEDKWNYNVKELDGELCTYIEEFLSSAWSKMKESADPKISEDKIGEGKYSWKDFKLESDDVSVPTGMIGRFKLDMSLLKNDDTVLCKSIDLETKSN